MKVKYEEKWLTNCEGIIRLLNSNPLILSVWLTGAVMEQSRHKNFLRLSSISVPTFRLMDNIEAFWNRTFFNCKLPILCLSVCVLYSYTRYSQYVAIENYSPQQTIFISPVNLTEITTTREIIIHGNKAEKNQVWQKVV